MNRLKHWLGLALLGAIFSSPSSADDLIMARSGSLFPEAMILLQNAISARGYTITRLQEVNENLARRKFQSDVYRVVYFGKYEEIKAVTAKHPELIPFLPLSITIFAEGHQAIPVTNHPRTLQNFFPDPALTPVFERWKTDVLAIMDEVREAK